jgi:DNA-binding GntR family transcriptional regulator
MDRDADRAVCKQLADEVRAAIDAGVYGPGDKVPSCAEIAKARGVHRDTARAALRILAQEGRVVTYPRAGTIVAGEDPRSVVYLSGPVRVSARMPSEPDAKEMGLPPGVPLLVVDYPAADGEEEGRTEQHPAHVTILELS